VRMSVVINDTRSGPVVVVLHGVNGLSWQRRRLRGGSHGRVAAAAESDTRFLRL
jgi:hypothetical protein